MLSKVKDTVWMGMAIGLAVPGVLVGITWFVMHQVAYLAKADLLLIGCIGVNAVLLKLFFKENKENAGRGILSVTFLWAFAFFFYKVSQS
ncbi:stationary phase survival protein SurE [Pedobacter sp. MC2016-14]|uniref:stationary phase survival protein SurE n=1 Tax=Pedobacter sp. MC2016-14 TaxID=2897327 RepID=UPI001E2B7393|nr:stationary phase survival protein SurE [Pedobacter sp. MC2016-14]MCD0488154.1 stationary phase survival protein SurE [Pedobacter sp. MC2016-14]